MAITAVNAQTVKVRCYTEYELADGGKGPCSCSCEPAVLALSEEFRILSGKPGQAGQSIKLQYSIAGKDAIYYMHIQFHICIIDKLSKEVKYRIKNKI